MQLYTRNFGRRPEFDDEFYEFQDYIYVELDGETLHVVETDEYWDYYVDEDELSCFKSFGSSNTWNSEEYEDRFDFEENHMYMEPSLELDTASNVEEHCYDLLEPFIPEEPGTYEIYGDIDLCYDVDAMSYTSNWNSYASKVSNVRIERID